LSRAIEINDVELSALFSYYSIKYFGKNSEKLKKNKSPSEEVLGL